MLRLDNITKTYVAGSLKVQALKGIDLNFRRSEFVSILGASGCGKTTMLNIIGGLDKYTTGDLVIGGKSTKEFNDRDWDVYRNHRIGFIFQSYNLIPHQNIIENVELALTIAGIGKQERYERAKKALDRVGLKDLYTKYPNQLSGGQCQRVAIARALVNEPEILLADEPTGALDSKTSVQIMDLIKEISEEKLVIMVTHNPDLAQQYSTRIVSLLDGKVVGDTNPYSDEDEKKEFETNIEESAEKIAKEKAKMSWWTAFKFSGKNLWTKRKRTIMTIVAASIGIVGVSAVLSVSYGVRGYITSMQDDMLSGNPISISKSTFDLTALTSTQSNRDKTQTVANSWKDGKIDVDYMLNTLVDTSEAMGNSMITNVVTPEYEAYLDAMPSNYYQAISKYYGIGIMNNIYTEMMIDKTSYDPEPDNNTYSISSISEFATSILRQTEYSAYSSMVNNYTNTLLQMVDNEKYVLSQYDLIDGGRFAKEADEMNIVVNSRGQLTDFTLTLMGYISQDEFINALNKALDNEDYDSSLDVASFTFQQLKDKEFWYFPNDLIYESTSTPGQIAEYKYHYQESWKSDPRAQKFKIVGILKAKEDISYGCLSNGFYYTPKFTNKFINDNIDSDIVSLLESSGDEEFTSIYYKVAGASKPQLSGIYYNFSYMFDFADHDHDEIDDIGLIGGTSSMSGFLAMLGSMGGGSGGGSASGYRTTTISLNQLGGSWTPTRIDIYPNSFDDKYLVTDYLDAWNESEEAIVVSYDDHKTGNHIEKTLTAEDREGLDITYTDSLEIIIGMINTVIDVVTIALVAFTALSLVVSTVMIAIITYVSVVERIKEIGVIRSLGGRKKDVSHLFNAETFIIGGLSGVFGIAVTYVIQIVLNIITAASYGVRVANLPVVSALIVIAISVILTCTSGLVPASSAARKDPVEALRTE